MVWLAALSDFRIDPLVLCAWLAARSIARGLPQPVADFGGYRVDTNSAAETRRWVFSRVGADLIELARSLDQPRQLLKLCGLADELRAALPDRWQLAEPRYFMVSVEETVERPLPAGYTADVEHDGAVVAARIKSGTGELVASGYAAETHNAFVFDRVVTAREHRRRGLASAVMAALRCSLTSHPVETMREGWKVSLFTFAIFLTHLW